jgi:hypothetical protein
MTATIAALDTAGGRDGDAVSPVAADEVHEANLSWRASINANATTASAITARRGP